MSVLKMRLPVKKIMRCPKIRDVLFLAIAMSLLTVIYVFTMQDKAKEEARYVRNYVSDLVVLVINSNITSTCTSILQNNNETIKLAAQHAAPSAKSADSYLNTNCESIMTSGYVLNEPLLSAEELSFPLALQILMYKDVWQFERLLRAVYRPHNFYCVHVDLRAALNVTLALHKLASCFPNVFTPEQRVRVNYGKISQLDAELACMRRLYEISAKWKYLINLTGQEFPLKTMWQLVRILKALNGSNAMEGTVSGMDMNFDRRDQLLPFARKYSITPVKGATHIVVVRGFVHFVLENPVALEMHQWLKDAPNPDETLFPTLNHNPSLKVPGAYLGLAEVDSVRYPFINRLKNWGTWPCHGFVRHSVCVWGVGDLPFITDSTRKELFVNKLEWNSQHYALDCLEQWYWNETLSELQQNFRGEQVQFDVSYYEKLDMVLKHV